MDKEREMFRYGPDTYFIGYTAILLIPEIIGLAITGFNNNSIYGRLPYWLLTCLGLSMLASFATGIAYVNHKANETKVKLNPMFIIVGVIALIYVVTSSIGIALYNETIIPIIGITLGFLGMAILSIQRKNWVVLFFTSISLAFLLLSSILK